MSVKLQYDEPCFFWWHLCLNDHFAQMRLQPATTLLHIEHPSKPSNNDYVIDIQDKSWIKPTLIAVNNQHLDRVFWGKLILLHLIKFGQCVNKNLTYNSSTLWGRGKTRHLLSSVRTCWTTRKIFHLSKLFLASYFSSYTE